MERARTTVSDQVDVGLTAYNGGLALVRDTRKISLPTGEVQLTFADVAQKIRPETVALRSTSKAGSVHILEQNYEYDLMSQEKLMEKYIGREVRLVNHDERIGFHEVNARLLSVQGGAIFEVEGEIHLGHPGSVVLPEVPDNLVAEPSLVWIVRNAESDQQLEATYLTRGISWKADYVATMAPDGSSFDLEGWVTLENASGASYRDARLKLVAGEVNVVRDRPPMAMAAGDATLDDIDFDLAEEESFADFHLYTIPRRTTIKQNQTKQVAFLSGTGVKSVRKYELRGQPHYYVREQSSLKGGHAAVFVEFENEEENGLGIPLPAGVMRLYQEDSEGSLQFAGEDKIDHTPKNETVRLRMGEAFDVIGERVQTDFKQVSKRVAETEIEVTVRNHKSEDIEVDVIEPIPRDWSMLNESIAHVKRDSGTAVFTVPVAADGETVLTYRARVRY